MGRIQKKSTSKLDANQEIEYQTNEESKRECMSFRYPRFCSLKEMKEYQKVLKLKSMNRGK